MAKKSKSQYGGNFVKKNGRTNNSSEYNHIYYLRNKHKWKGREIDGTYYDNVRSYDKNGEKGWEFYSETEKSDSKGVYKTSNSLAVIPVKSLFSSTKTTNWHLSTSGSITAPNGMSHVYNIVHTYNDTIKKVGAADRILNSGKRLVDWLLRRPPEHTKQTNGGFAMRR